MHNSMSQRSGNSADNVGDSTTLSGALEGNIEGDSQAVHWGGSVRTKTRCDSELLEASGSCTFVFSPLNASHHVAGARNLGDGFRCGE